MKTSLCCMTAVLLCLVSQNVAAQEPAPPTPAPTPNPEAIGDVEIEDDVDVEVQGDVEIEDNVDTEVQDNLGAEDDADANLDIVDDGPSGTAASAAVKPAAPVATEQRPAKDTERQVPESPSEPTSPQPKERKEGLAPTDSTLRTTAPGGDSLLDESLEAEGSNYRMPMRLGFSLWGFVQAQYVVDQLSEDQVDPDGQPLNRNQFQVPRARLHLSHGWKYAFANLELEAGTVGPPVRIRRAEASLLYRGNVSDEIPPLLVMTAGVTDIPFGAELAESQRDRLFMERSLPNRALFPSNADLGVKLWGVAGPFEYSAAVVNGEPLNDKGWPQDFNSAKDIVGRVGAQAGILGMGRLGGGVSFYVGRGFSEGTPATKDSLQWVDLNSNGVVDDGEVQGATGSSALSSESFTRYAIGLDVKNAWKLPWGSLQLGAEGFAASNLDRGLLPNDPAVSGADSRQLGLSAFFVQSLFDWTAVGFRGAFYAPNTTLTEQRAGIFHLRNLETWELSPTLTVLFDRARLSAEYDIILDQMGRDSAGVPTDVANNRFTVRLQVDL